MPITCHIAINDGYSKRLMNKILRETNVMLYDAITSESNLLDFVTQTSSKASYSMRFPDKSILIYVAIHEDTEDKIKYIIDMIMNTTPSSDTHLLISTMNLDYLPKEIYEKANHVYKHYYGSVESDYLCWKTWFYAMFPTVDKMDAVFSHALSGKRRYVHYDVTAGRVMFV